MSTPRSTGEEELSPSAMDEADALSAAQSHWKNIEPPGLSTLSEAWSQAMGAARALELVGRAYLESREDDSHTSMRWLAGPQALATCAIPTRNAVAAGLSLSRLELVVLGADETRLDEFSLDGLSINDGLDWLHRQIERRTHAHSNGAEEKPGQAAVSREALVAGPPASPRHGPESSGRAFRFTHATGFRALEQLYANADALLNAFARATPSASPVRCWPHHFDIATLVKMAPAGPNREPTTISFGLAPPDDVCGTGYFYAAPWPARRVAGLPRLDVGEWRAIDGRALAVLPLPLVFHAGDDAPEAILRFFEDAGAPFRAD